MKLPVLFLGHGSPMNAIKPSVYTQAWTALGQRLRQQYGQHIRAILAISAHWVTHGNAVTAMEKPRTIHDFGGFPQALHEVNYPAAGDPELAAAIQRLLLPLPVAADQSWGLDHGSWGVLCHLFPDADVPVLQLSLNAGFSAQQHFELGQRLAALREQGVLIVASGNIVHNLRAFDWSSAASAGAAYDWAEQTRTLVNDWLRTNNNAALTDEAHYPAEWHLAAPTPEHFWPLLYIAGARSESEPIDIFCDDIIGKALSMTCVAIGLPAQTRMLV